MFAGKRIVIIGHGGLGGNDGAFFDDENIINVDINVVNGKKVSTVVDLDKLGAKIGGKVREGTLIDLVACSSCANAESFSNALRIAGAKNVLVRNATRIVDPLESGELLFYTGDKSSGIKVAGKEFYESGQMVATEGDGNELVGLVGGYRIDADGVLLQESPEKVINWGGPEYCE